MSPCDHQFPRHRCHQVRGSRISAATEPLSVTTDLSPEPERQQPLSPLELGILARRTSALFSSTQTGASTRSPHRKTNAALRHFGVSTGLFHSALHNIEIQHLRPKFPFTTASIRRQDWGNPLNQVPNCSHTAHTTYELKFSGTCLLPCRFPHLQISPTGNWSC